MSPKPNRNGGWLGRRAARLKSLAVVGTVTLGFAGIGIAAAGPAAADPATTYVAVGTDTTQDVMNGFAGGVSDGVLGSWNAVNPVTGAVHEIINPAKALAGGSQLNCNFTRPGRPSKEGFDAFDKAVNPGTPLPQLAVPPQQFCIDISRSTDAPGSIATTGPGSLSLMGNLVYVPFAVDNPAAGATGPTTAGQTTTTNCAAATAGCTNVVNGIGTITFTVPVTSLTTADLFTLNDLITLYKNCGDVTEGGITYNPNSAGPGQQQINLYVPQAGSVLRNIWASELTFSATTLPPCVHDTILAGPAATLPVGEEDGTVFASDPNGYGPFSITQWISQSNSHVADNRHTAIPRGINGTPPTVSGALNPQFPILRLDYNVVQFDRVVNTANGNFDATLSGLFAGTGSRLCQSTFTIKSYGFAPVPSTLGICGDTSSGLRVVE